MRSRAKFIAACLVALSTSVLSVPATPVASAQSAEAAQVCRELSSEFLLRTWRGWSPDRGGNITAIPNEPNFVGGGLPHAGPWDYLQETPLLFYGPGFIKDRGSVSKPVMLTDVAPTTGAIVGFDFDAPDGRVLDEALMKQTLEGKKSPKLVVTLVWDSGGRDVLDRWPNAWPNLRKLGEEGTWFENATLGTSPSDTPPVHGTIGTGAWPAHHGLLDQLHRIGPEMRTPWGSGPNSMLLPSLADLYDLSRDNEPVIGAIASLGAHLGMIGHGSLWGGGDKDIAINRENTSDEGDEGVTWNLRSTIAPYFNFPQYILKEPPITKYNKELDQEDGVVDNKWMGNSFSELRGGFDTPSRIPYQTAAIKKVIAREDFGKDEVPDLLYLNYKIIDNVGHKFSADSREMEDTIKHQDAELKILTNYLDKKVGENEWVLIMTADHGAQRDPAVTGAFNASPGAMEANLAAKFAGGGETVPWIQEIRPTQLWVDEKAAKADGVTLQEVVTHLRSLQQSDVPSGGMVGGPEKLYATVFESSLLPKLPCIRKDVKTESVPGWAENAAGSTKEPEPAPSP